MGFITIIETSEGTKISIVRNIFQENNINFQILDENTNNTLPIGARVQVAEDQVERAKLLLRENGFLEEEKLTEEGDIPKSQFWTYLFFALLIVIIVGILIYWLMNPQ